MLTAIYFSIFTFYISQYSLKLKTLYNIETDYNYKIVLLLKEAKRMNHDKSPIILIGFMVTVNLRLVNTLQMSKIIIHRYRFIYRREV